MIRGSHHAHPANTPVECLALLHELIDIHRLVGSVETTDTEMDYADSDLRAVVTRHWDGQRSEVGLSQRCHLFRALT